MSKCENCLSKNVCRWYENGTGKNLCCADDFPCPEQKDKDRFIETPCKVGGTLYQIVDMSHTACKSFVSDFPIRVLPYQIYYLNIMGGISGIPFDNFGKTVFLTKEEAEQALKERSGDNA